MSTFRKLRAKVAEAIAPSQPLDRQGVSRFVQVRFFAPGLPAIVDSYDTEKQSDMAAWRENQRLYPSQVLAQSAEPF